MAEMERPHPRRRWSLSRAFWVGFVLGLVVTVPAVFFALLSPVGEALLPVLTPGSLLLRPMAEVMATWPGLLNVGLVAVANGLVYGSVAVALVRLMGVVRR
jgi:hypothetical protein